jgi:hypothetical protein
MDINTGIAMKSADKCLCRMTGVSSINATSVEVPPISSYYFKGMQVFQCRFGDELGTNYTSEGPTGCNEPRFGGLPV